MRSSEICTVDNAVQGMDKIIYILKKLNADKYITGQGEGSKRYINESTFKKEKIELIWHDYKHIEYIQLHEPFI